MLWTLWRTEDERAFNVHLEYEFPKGVPCRANLADGKTGDAKNLRDHLSRDRLYILARGYQDYGLFAAILNLNNSFVAPFPVDRKTTALRAQKAEAVLSLATDLLGLPAELIVLICRCRWQIELFFRWFEMILKADHLLSQSKNGLAIVFYCAMIASLPIVLWTGRKPARRTWEMLCHYFAGWVEDAEWEAYLGCLGGAVA